MNALLSMFQTPTAQQIAAKELKQAARQLLEAQASAEYSTHMVNYHGNRIRRLTKYLAEVA